MDSCICQICVCGNHRCGFRRVKDLFNKDPTLNIPNTETKAAFRGYPGCSTTEIIRPIDAGWYFREYPASLSTKRIYEPSLTSDSNDLDRVDQAQKRIVESSEEKDLLDKMPDLPVERGSRMTSENGVQTETSAPKSEPLPKKVLVIPSLSSFSETRASYPAPKPLSQLPNCRKAFTKAFKPPDQPMETKTSHMMDFKEWDVTQGHRAPNAKTGKLELCIFPDTLKFDNLPMKYLTTYRDYHAPPIIDVTKLRLVLQEEPKDVCNTNHNETSCNQNATPDEKYIHNAFYRTIYMKDFKAPCGSDFCEHGRDINKPKKYCPAACLIGGHEPQNYRFVGTCYGHDIFRKKHCG